MQKDHLVGGECGGVVADGSGYRETCPSGGPARDNQARAVKLELQWSEAARLGGRI